MKKIGLLFLGTFMSLMLFTTSCDVMVGAAQGYGEAGYGYTIIGSASSKSQCQSNCESSGYSSSSWYSDTKNCFCK